MGPSAGLVRRSDARFRGGLRDGPRRPADRSWCSARSKGRRRASSRRSAGHGANWSRTKWCSPRLARSSPTPLGRCVTTSSVRRFLACRTVRQRVSPVTTPSNYRTAPSPTKRSWSPEHLIDRGVRARRSRSRGQPDRRRVLLLLPPARAAPRPRHRQRPTGFAAGRRRRDASGPGQYPRLRRRRAGPPRLWPDVLRNPARRQRDPRRLGCAALHDHHLGHLQRPRPGTR